MDAEDEVFKGKKEKNIRFCMKVEDLDFWSSTSIRAHIFSYMINVFFPINFVGVPSLSSPLWLLDVIDSGGSLLLLCLSLSGSFSPKVFKSLPSYLENNYDVVPFNWRV